MNYKLKGALYGEFGSQTAAARAMGISEWKLSRIIRGWAEPNENELRSLSEALGPGVVALIRREAAQDG